jgi:hypothetical protein
MVKKIISLFILCCLLSGCSFIACGDRGVAGKYGFLWLKYKCEGDKYCEQCKEWVHFQYDCNEVCKK